MTLTSRAVQLYRCYVIWNDPRVIFFPFLVFEVFTSLLNKSNINPVYSLPKLR